MEQHMLSNIGNIFMMEHNLFRGEQKLSIFFIHFTSLVKAILTSLPKTKQYPFTSHLSPIIPTLANLWQFTMWLQYWAGAGVWAAESCWHSGITYCYNLCLIWLVTGAMRHRPSPYLKWDPQTLQAHLSKNEQILRWMIKICTLIFSKLKSEENCIKEKLHGKFAC